MSIEQRLREEARLFVLKTLQGQSDNRLSSTLMRDELDLVHGINRSRAWVHEEFAYLANLGAIRVTAMGDVQIAQLLQKGADHLERRHAIEGVKKPPYAEG